MTLPINAIQILTECGSCLKTGCLTIENQHVQWRVFFNNGELQYADCSAKDLSQLQYFFLKKGWNEALAILKKMPADPALPESPTAKKDTEFDQAMAWIWLHKGLEPSQLNELVKEISIDALESFLWLTSGVTQWKDREAFPSWIQASAFERENLDLAQTLKYLIQRLKEWQKSSKTLTSPHQRPYLLDFKDIQKPCNGNLSPEALDQLASLLRRGLSLRQLSLYLKQDEIYAGQLLSPYLDSKIIHLRPPNPPFDQLPKILKDLSHLSSTAKKKVSKSHKIVCIDDSPTMLTEMNRFLTHDKYEVTTIEDPVKASATIFKIKPDLILLDITMPKINGYSLCSLLRNSSSFDDTPIIMVSGNTGLIDKARAKICGATGYLTKPFSQQELLNIVNKHLVTA